LANDNDYLQIYEKYLYLMWSGRKLWVELLDKVLEYPFTVKLVSVDAVSGAVHDIIYNGGHD
jgi:hypothetical protein